MSYFNYKLTNSNPTIIYCEISIFFNFNMATVDLRFESLCQNSNPTPKLLNVHHPLVSYEGKISLVRENKNNRVGSPKGQT